MDKEKQKKILIEIMQDDEKDGLYKPVTNHHTLTAVEWLINELEIYQNGESKLLYVEILEQAKQMEKKQIIDAYYQCGRDNFEHIKVINRSATEYYNDTFLHT